MGIKILSTGRYIPAKCVENAVLEQALQVEPDWISQRTGIHSRYVAENEDTFELALKAAQNAMEKGNIKSEEIGAVIVATFTSDYMTPSIACLLQAHLNLPENIVALDINGACSGFVLGLKLCDSLLLQQPEDKKILLVGAEVITKLLDMDDRNTSVLFGDGAAAAVIAKGADTPEVFVTGCRGNNTDLVCPGINNRGDQAHVFMNGKAVFRFAVEVATASLEEALVQKGWQLEDLDYIVCHQANERILQSLAKHLHLPETKFYKNIAQYANTSSASIPIALDEMAEKNLLKPGVKLALIGFGAGFTWATTVISY